MIYFFRVQFNVNDMDIAMQTASNSKKPMRSGE